MIFFAFWPGLKENRFKMIARIFGAFHMTRARLADTFFSQVQHSHIFLESSLSVLENSLMHCPKVNVLF